LFGIAALSFPRKLKLGQRTCCPRGIQGISGSIQGFRSTVWEQGRVESHRKANRRCSSQFLWTKDGLLSQRTHTQRAPLDGGAGGTCAWAIGRSGNNPRFYGRLLRKPCLMKKSKKMPRTTETVFGRKEPKSSEDVPGKRQPKSVEDVSFGHLKAAWRINRMQLVSPYSWRELPSEKIEYVQKKLSEFEQRTWNEIFVDDKRHNHPLPVSKLKCPQARKWMADHMPGEDHLWTLRLSGAERIWGIFREGIYQVIFWDPRHLIWEVYK
jgi:hypothetical protein